MEVRELFDEITESLVQQHKENKSFNHFAIFTGVKIKIDNIEVKSPTIDKEHFFSLSEILIK